MHLGLIGYGAIAAALLELLADDPVEEVTILVRPTSRDRAASDAPRKAAARIRIVTEASDLVAAAPDLTVECAGQAAVSEVAPRILDAGLDLLIVSIGALADDTLAARLSKLAAEKSARIILPAGAIGGIDLLSAIAPAGGLSVRYRGSKPPAAWKGTMAETLLDLDGMTEPATFFTGTAREAALSYPKNANVAATLALAGAGFDATRAELCADPAATGNRHAYEVISPLCRYSIEIENAASGGNARTSLTTVYSVLREIDRLRRPMIL